MYGHRERPSGALRPGEYEYVMSVRHYFIMGTHECETLVQTPLGLSKARGVPQSAASKKKS